MRRSELEESVGGAISVGADTFDPMRVRELVKLIARPEVLLTETPRLLAEWTKVALNLSEIEIPSRDPFYGDRRWHENPVYRRLAQGHLAWTQSVERMTTVDGADWESQKRARYLTDILTGAASPANFFPTNPVAVSRALETGGMSVVRGMQHFLRDLKDNGGMPSMVDTTPFRVGENMACTAGSVVYREDIFELLHYQPTTEQVYRRPLLFVPPELNRHYVLDLAPGRSMVEFAISHGMQTFMIVWRNPREDPALGHGTWGLEEYLEAHIRAFDIVREITGAKDLNLVGLCAGGMTSALVQAHLAESGANPVNAATYIVTMLDARKPNGVTMMATPGVEGELSKAASDAKVYKAKQVAHNFAWMRPKDLVFNYVIHDWLLGEEAPSFDVLAWNDDATNLSAKFSRDTNGLLANHMVAEPGGMTLLGTPIDLSKVTSDGFVVAGQRDHITTWRPCYMTSQLLGGDKQVVIVNSGHIQTFVNAPGSSRYKYRIAPAGGPDPDAWLAQAQEHQGSWWPDWIDWLEPRSGTQKPAPASLGNKKYPPQEPAPGTYVHEK
ncbi:MAG: alpha/beta fold hydrolase [Intrasporangium sp.]|uniref:PHA/PHB synthase family protein n=1 Tax=Intrasporangium sp. TaxID=1925024 RepID=UPI0026479B14|nr:alpha/beta fold hydrolase [Intrasporangium sp.]MDN5795523.1 alpha/beta fold hydrolase [Intrasporangium sp.]